MRLLFALLLFPARIIFSLLGVGRGITYLPEDHPEMRKAIYKAKATLPEFRNALLSSEPGLDNFAIKVALPAVNGHEHCWVSELTVDGFAFKGRLSNAPQHVKGLTLGSVIYAKQEMISDWAYSRDGVFQGHFTTRVLLTRMNKRQKKQITQLFGWNDEAF